MPEQYESVYTVDGQAFVKSSSIESLSSIDAIVFDCDGVLVDASKSYDATIIKVTDLLVQEFLGHELPWRKLGPPLILQLRRTGLFNNDWDTTYALIVLSALALCETRSGSISSEGPARILKLINEFAASVNDTSPAFEVVNRYAKVVKAKSLQDFDMLYVQEKLGYPGSPPRSYLATIFDEIYHGPRLYRQMYGTAARYYREKGLIEREKVLVSRTDLDYFDAYLGKGRMAIATGRPFLAAKHVLKSILEYFVREASFFLGDMVAHPELAVQLSSFRKPSGQGLVHASKALSSNMLLYVGDSAEDIMMIENACPVIAALSAGVYGTSFDEAGQATFFRNRKVDLILPSARALRKIMGVTKK